MLILQVRLEQVPVPLGYLRRDDHGELTFIYDQDYIALATPLPLSLSLPLSQQPFNDYATRSYFGNLIQENDQLEQVMQRHSIDRNDIAGLLEHLGADCPGAISCLPIDSDPVKVPGNLSEDYDVLDPKLVIEIVDRLAKKQPLPDEVKDPSPLAGVQNKIAICALPDGSFAMPKAGLGVPTTHIMKVPAIADRKDAGRERLSALLADQAGLNTSIAEVRKIGDYDALIIERFDRKVSDGEIVTRIHQEDFMQAAGLPYTLKYERRGNDTRRFDAKTIAGILQKCAQPALSMQNFILATFFNLAIGNNDNHGKNHALIYDQGPVPRLAPLYDMLPILLSSEYTEQLAFNIGAAKFAEDVSADDITYFMAIFGRTKNATRRFLTDEVTDLLEKVEHASEHLVQKVDKSFDDLIGREIGQLSDNMNLNIGIRERDLFTSSGGGWQVS